MCIKSLSWILLNRNLSLNLLFKENKSRVNRVNDRRLINFPAIQITRFINTLNTCFEYENANKRRIETLHNVVFLDIKNYAMIIHLITIKSVQHSEIYSY